MTLFALIIFFTSLFGIIALFMLKRAEETRESRYAESFRTRADVGALRIKALVHQVEFYLENTPWFVSALARYGVHVGALSFARLARSSAEQAHRLADLVSHKHRFERRETKSQFLKEVSEYPIRNSRDVNSNGAGKNGKNEDSEGVATR